MVFARRIDMLGAAGALSLLAIAATGGRTGSHGAVQLRGRLVRGAQDRRTRRRPARRPSSFAGPTAKASRRFAPNGATRAPTSTTRLNPHRRSSSPRRASSKRTSRRTSPSCTIGRSGSPRRTNTSRRRSTPASSGGDTTPSSSPRRRCPSPSAGRISSIPPTRTKSRWRTRGRRARRSTPCRRSCSSWARTRGSSSSPR